MIRPTISRQEAAEAALLAHVEALRELLTAPVASARVHARIRHTRNRFENVALLLRDERRQGGAA